MNFIKNSINLMTMLTSYFQIASSVNKYQSPTFKPAKPEKCNNVEVLYRLCCILPPFFTHDVSESCGGAYELIMYININSASSLQQHFEDIESINRQRDMKQKLGADNAVTMKTVILQCAHWYCVLDKYGFITRNGYLEHEKFFNHLDTWAGMNPAFVNIMRLAKIQCKQVLRFYFPLKPCEFYKLNMCIRNYISVNCPVSLPAQECAEQKEYYKECEQYYH